MTIQKYGLFQWPLNRITADNRCIEKRAGAIYLAEDKTGVTIHGGVEFAEHPNEFCEDEAALVETFSDDMSVDSLDFCETDAGIEG